MSSLEILEDFVNKAQNAIINFIWNSIKGKIKNKVLIQKIEYGGLKVPHVDVYNKANHVTEQHGLKDVWIQKIEIYNI